MSTKKAAFQAIKKTFSIASILQHFDLEKVCIIETNALNFISAVVYSQLDNKNVLQPLAFILY